MGQKVNPKIFRIGVNQGWSSSWYARKQKYAQLLQQDILIRKRVLEKLANSGVAGVDISRSANQVTLTVWTSKPGVLIGRQGASIQELKVNLEKEFKERFDIAVKEVKKPYLNAAIVAEMIGAQIMRRMPYRRAVKSVLERAVEAGAKGIKVYVGGRLNGAEISRSEYFLEGKIPLQTLRSDIDFARFGALTGYGMIGVKVWIYRGEKFTKRNREDLSSVPSDRA